VNRTTSRAALAFWAAVLVLLCLTILLVSCDPRSSNGLGNANGALGASGPADSSGDSGGAASAILSSGTAGASTQTSELMAKRIAIVQASGFPRRFATVHAKFNLENREVQTSLAKFDAVSLGLYAEWNGFASRQPILDAARALKAINPAVLVGNYSILNEAYLDTTGGWAERTAKLNAENWWLRTASGSMVQWTSAYGAWDINITNWSKPDANGQRYAQWAADYYDRLFFAAAPVFDFWFFDNVMSVPRDRPASWKLDGANQHSTDTDVAAAFRAGEAAEWVEARRLEPDMLLVGNADSDLSSAEYKGQLNGAFLECLTGIYWSIETWGGWAQMMGRYRAVVANLAPPQLVVFHGCGGVTDYAMFRYSLASALMGDGYFSYNSNGDLNSVVWYDEYDVKLGAPVQGPVGVAYQGGVYRRDFENGIILVNPRGNGRQTVNLGGTFRKIAGKQDPTINNGQAVTSVTLNAADGLVLTR